MSSESMLSDVRARLGRVSDSGVHDCVTDQYIAIARGHGDELVLKANRCGLIYLASQLVEIADREPGAHVQLDAAAGLDACEMPLVIAHRRAPWEDQSAASSRSCSTSNVVVPRDGDPPACALARSFIHAMSPPRSDALIANGCYGVVVESVNVSVFE